MMSMTRKTFLSSSAAFAAAGFAKAARAAEPAAAGADYAAFRKVLRAFYPDWGQGDNDVVKDPRQAASYARIEGELKAW